MEKEWTMIIRPQEKLWKVNLKEKEMLSEYGVGDRFCHHWVTNDNDLFSFEE